MKVSIALCTYNGQEYISEQLKSIVQQTIGVDEVVVSDDGSTDGTLNIIENFSKQYPKICWIINTKAKSEGVVKNFESAIALTTGDLIFLCDQDDIWRHDKVEKTIGFFRDNPRTIMMFTNANLIDANGQPLPGDIWSSVGFTEQQQKRWRHNFNAFADLYFNENHITGAAAAFKSTLKAYMPSFMKPFTYYHDSLLGLQSAAINGLGFYQEQLISYRIHAKQQVGTGNGINYKQPPLLTRNMGYISVAEYRRRILLVYPVWSIVSIVQHYVRAALKKIGLIQR